MKNVIAMVLGGGQGSRLLPLTKYRSKPAVPLAGKYRLIDIPLSNCINSGLNHIYVLTQFLSVSLHRHIRSTYRFDSFNGGFVELLAAQQTMSEGTDWYQGTADAVRKNIRYLQQPGIDYVMILSGDQLYRMNYRDMIRTHKETNADATIGALPVTREEAAAFGIMRLEDSGRVLGFVEKPKTPEAIEPVRMDPAWIDARGLESRGRDLLASMGIYVFNRDLLVDALLKTDLDDFGKGVFPALLDEYNIQTHLFDGYWEDVGTIRSFFDANLALAGEDPAFHMTSATSPIYTRARFLAPTRIDGAVIRSSLVADGCVIEQGAMIENSVVGLRCRVGKNATIRNSVLMGNDSYETPRQLKTDKEAGRPPVGIGEGSVIDGSIVNKGVRIGHHVHIVDEHQRENADICEGVCIRDGIICVEKEAVIHDKWRLP